MAAHIHLAAETADGYRTSDQDGDGDVVSNADVRAALSDLDVSESSPVAASGRLLATAVEEGAVHVRGGAKRSGSFTKKSQSALVEAVESVDGLADVTVESGGYDPE